MTYPTWMTAKGRQQLYEACLIAGIQERPIMISESTATVVNYAQENSSNLSRIKAPKTVVFVDMGYSQTTVTAAKFKQVNDGSRYIKGTVLCHVSNKNLGGRDLDWALLKNVAVDI